jgi:hypothetical protein
MDIHWIRNSVRNGNYLWTLHGDEERRNDGLGIAEAESALVAGEILETYPADRRGESCLVLGKIDSRSIHFVCGKNHSGLMVIITVYLPTMPKWKSPTERNHP